MPEYNCEPGTLWMLVTLLPVAAAFFGYMRVIEWWTAYKYPRLVEDMNRRKLFENGMIVGGLFVSILAWGLLFEALCRV